MTMPASPFDDLIQQIIGVQNQIGNNREWLSAIKTAIEILDEEDEAQSIAAAEMKDGRELRFDIITGGDIYIGRANDGAPESAHTWKVVRFYRTAAGKLTRMRYRKAIRWDQRTDGWT